MKLFGKRESLAEINARRCPDKGIRYVRDLMIQHYAEDETQEYVVFLVACLTFLSTLNVAKPS